jgi:hypothetical protein
VTKRERELKRHADIHHGADSRKKIDQGDISKGKDPGDLHESTGLINTSRKPAAAGEKEEKADDPLVFEHSWKICRITQGGALVTNKTQSKVNSWRQ